MRFLPLTAFLSLVPTSAPAADTLRLLNWEAYLSDAVIAEWQARTGATLEQVYFDNDEDRNAALASHDQGLIDLVVIDQVTAPVFGSRDILLPVSDHDAIPNLVHIGPEWADQCGTFGVPYLWGTLGLAYRRDRLDPPASWTALLEPVEHLHGHIGMLDDYVDTLAPSLLLRGESINTDDEGVLAEIFDELRQVLPSVLTFAYPLTFTGSHPRADQLYLTLAYSGDQHQLSEATGTQWGYVIPTEGTVLWTDCLAVMADSANTALAFDFINFLNEPSVAAANSETLNVATPNAAALPLQSERFRTDPLVYPRMDILQRSQHYDTRMSAANIRVRSRITSSLVNLHDAQ